jgi:hypothetical protein
VFSPAKIEQVELAREGDMERQEPKQLPLPWEFWSIFPLAITYAAARGYLVVEAFLGSRFLEARAYVNIKWSSYIQHV